MPTSKAQIKAANKYIKNHYARINLTMSKLQKDNLTNHANKQNSSINSFINEAIDEKISRDNATDHELPNSSTKKKEHDDSEFIKLDKNLKNKITTHVKKRNEKVNEFIIKAVEQQIKFDDENEVILIIDKNLHEVIDYYLLFETNESASELIMRALATQYEIDND